MKNSLKTAEKIVESEPENFEKDVDEYYEKLERKAKDLSLLKRASNVLVSVWEISTIILKLSQGHSIVITENGHIFSGKINTSKLRDLGIRVAGKNDGHFDVNSEVSSDNSVLDNQEFSHSKQYVNSAKSLKVNTHLFSGKIDSAIEIFFDAWKYQEKNNPKNVQISYEKSPMGHDYMLVKIAGITDTAKIAVKTGQLMYFISPDGKEIPV